MPRFEPPFVGESGAGYLARVEFANDYDDGWIRELVGGPSGAMTPWSPKQVATLAAFTAFRSRSSAPDCASGATGRR